MTRFAFVTWDGGGNVPPAIGIAQELISHGHEVFFVGYEVQRKRFETKGLKFVALRRSGQFDIYAAVSPPERIGGLMTNVWASADHLQDIPDAVVTTGADVVVIDFLMQGALASASQLLAPVAVLAHSSIAGLIPPPASPMGAARLAATNGLRQGAGLPPLSRLNEGWAGLHTLVTTISALDPAADEADSYLHYIGPVIENFPGESWDSPWAPDDDRPLVLVSFSTTGLWDQRGRVRNTLEALAGEPVRVLVSAPQHADLEALPGNAVVRGFVPHSLVLPGAAVTVTHAGHGTVCASLDHGVPIVALPNPVADQPFLAARSQELGAGIDLPGEAGPEEIRVAVMEVLGNAAYASAAADLADQIGAAPGVAGATSQLEQLAPTAHETRPGPHAAPGRECDAGHAGGAVGRAVSGKRFLFVMWEGGGNVPPQLGLAHRLVQRGHDVCVLTEPSLEADVTSIGARFMSFTRAPHRRDRSVASDFVRDFDARTPLGAFAAVRDRVLLGPAAAYAQDTMAAIEQFRPDVMAPDWMLTGAAVAGEAAQIPTALLVHNINQLPEPGKPAPGFGFLPATSALTRSRDRAFGALFLRLFNKGLPALNDARQQFGLPPLGHVLEHMELPDRYLLQYSESFDLPADRHRPNLRYVGPELAMPNWVEPWASPWATGDGIPLVLVSLSSTYMAQERVLRTCIAAVGDLPVRALVTVGPAVDPSTFLRPDNVRVVASAPHDLVLPQAAAVLTHGGLGTVTRSLFYGVPLVCIPMGRDQGDNSARVVWHQAGLRVSPRAGATKVAAALQRVIDQSSFRDAAVRLGATIKADVLANRGVLELESLLRKTVR
jgi:MGT family glycosyltransferase